MCIKVLRGKELTEEEVNPPEIICRIMLVRFLDDLDEYYICKLDGKRDFLKKTELT